MWGFWVLGFRVSGFEVLGLWGFGILAVYADGTLCLDIIQDAWSPCHNVSTILTSIQVKKTMKSLPGRLGPGENNKKRTVVLRVVVRNRGVVQAEGCVLLCLASIAPKLLRGWWSAMILKE